MSKANALVLALSLTLIATESFAAPSLSSTTAAEADHWQVSTVVGATDGALASFSTANFQTAVATTGKVDWIANNSSGTNGYVGNWTFFIFRQTFDLTGYDPTTAKLSFQWGADDSGEVFASRGSWTPKFRLNDGALISDTGGYYGLGSPVNLASGFKAGQNTIDFYVEGNGVTDGMTLKTVSFTALPVPEPEAYAMLMAGLGLLGVVARRKKNRLA